MSVADEPGRLGLVERGVEDVGDVGVLAADEDERASDARGPARDQHPLDQQVRVALHELAVLEGARLGLVGVADEVLVHVALGQEGGLLAHREAGAAAAAHAGGEQLVEDLLRLHLHGARAAARSRPRVAVAVERVQAGVVDALEEEASLVCRPAVQRQVLGQRPARQLLVGQRRAALAQVLDERLARPRRSAGRRRRRSTEAIGAMSHAPRHSKERTLKSGSLPATRSELLVERVGPAQRAGDVRAHVDRVATRRARLEHVVEGRDGDQVARGQAHHAGDLLDRGRRAPAVERLGGHQRRDRRAAAVRVAGHVVLDLRAQVRGHGRRRRVRDRRGRLLEIDRLVPAGDAGAVLVAADPCQGSMAMRPCTLRRSRRMAAPGSRRVRPQPSAGHLHAPASTRLARDRRRWGRVVDVVGGDASVDLARDPPRASVASLRASSPMSVVEEGRQSISTIRRWRRHTRSSPPVAGAP